MNIIIYSCLPISILCMSSFAILYSINIESRLRHSKSPSTPLVIHPLRLPAEDCRRSGLDIRQLPPINLIATANNKSGKTAVAKLSPDHLPIQRRTYASFKSTYLSLVYF